MTDNTQNAQQSPGLWNSITSFFNNGGLEGFLNRQFGGNDKSNSNASANTGTGGGNAPAVNNAANTGNNGGSNTDSSSNDGAASGGILPSIGKLLGFNGFGNAPGSQMAGVAGVLGSLVGGPFGKMLGWGGTAGVAITDAVKGFRENGWQGAMTGGLDALLMGGVSTMAAGMGGGILTKLIMGVVGLVLAKEILVPLAHFAERKLGLPVPGENGGSGTQANNGGPKNAMEQALTVKPVQGLNAGLQNTADNSNVLGMAAGVAGAAAGVALPVAVSMTSEGHAPNRRALTNENTQGVVTSPVPTPEVTVTLLPPGELPQSARVAALRGEQGGVVPQQAGVMEAAEKKALANNGQKQQQQHGFTPVSTPGV